MAEHGRKEVSHISMKCVFPTNDKVYIAGQIDNFLPLQLVLVWNDNYQV